MSTLLERRRAQIGRAKAEAAEMSTPAQLAKEMNMENVRTAGNLLGRYFCRFADSISEAERNEFFDGRNRDLWTSEFARFLEGQIDRDHPSND